MNYNSIVKNIVTAEINWDSFTYYTLSANSFNHVFKISHNHKEYILKIYNNSDRFSTEYNTYKILSHSNISNIPRIIKFSTTNQSFPFLILTPLKGTQLINTKRNDVYFTNHIANAIGKIIAELSSVTVEYFGSYTSGQFQNWSIYVDYRFSLAIEACLRKNIITKDLAKIIPKYKQKFNSELIDTKPSIVHGDLVSKNIMIDQQNINSMLNIYDFEHSIFGSFEWDLINIYRSFLGNYPNTEKTLLRSIIQNSQNQKFVNNRLAAFKKVRPLYSILEAMEFWSWGIDNGFDEEIKQGSKQVTKMLRSFINE